MRSTLFAAVAFTSLVANIFHSEQPKAAPLGAGSFERAASQVDLVQYPYYFDDRYYAGPYPRHFYPPSVYYPPQRYYERRAAPSYSSREYEYSAPGYFDEPIRPTSCGQYRYWNGEYCADARYERPYLGPKW
jgi:hypothetical protein